jgi:hypothetical protein
MPMRRSPRAVEVAAAVAPTAWFTLVTVVQATAPAVATEALAVTPVVAVAVVVMVNDTGGDCGDVIIGEFYGHTSST